MCTLECSHNQTHAGKATPPTSSQLPPTMSQSQSQSQSQCGRVGGGGGKRRGTSHRQTSLAVAVCSLHSCPAAADHPLPQSLTDPPLPTPLPCPALHCPPLGPVSLAAPFYHCVRLRGLFARVNIKFEPQANEPSRAEQGAGSRVCNVFFGPRSLTLWVATLAGLQHAS